ITRPLAERMAVAREDERIGVVIEVRTDSGVDLEGLFAELAGMVLIAAPGSTMWRTGGYLMASLTRDEILTIVDRDSGLGGRVRAGRDEAKTAPRSFINRIWPNFEVRATIHRSVITVKADAAVRSFDATGDGIVWAVLDTGLDAAHPHFATYETLDL